MTRILGIDPGETSAWCLYESWTRSVVACGHFKQFDLPVSEILSHTAARIAVIERPKAYGPTRPQVVECAYIAGRLFDRVRNAVTESVYEIERREVKKVLTAATNKDVVVVDDATAWSALVLLHGEGSDAKPRTRKGVEVAPGGAIGRVTGHERAALAVAVAFALRANQVTPTAP